MIVWNPWPSAAAHEREPQEYGGYFRSAERRFSITPSGTEGGRFVVRDALTPLNAQVRVRVTCDTIAECQEWAERRLLGDRMREELTDE